MFRRSQLRAEEIAVPRTRMVAAPVDRPVSEVLKLAADSAYTRIPIYEGDIDHIVGFVHLRDLFALYRTDAEADVRSIVRPGALCARNPHQRRGVGAARRGAELSGDCL